MKVNKEMAVIPTKRKSLEELKEVRVQNSLQGVAPQSVVQEQLMHPIAIIAGYVFSLVGLGVLFYPFIVWRKRLSSHHGGFMCLLSVMVIAAAGVYMYETSFDRALEVKEVTESQLDAEYLKEGGDEEMSLEELDAYLEALRIENEKDPDFKAWAERQQSEKANVGLEPSEESP